MLYVVCISLSLCVLSKPLRLGLNICLYMYVCMYVCIYIYTYIHTYVYYTHTLPFILLHTHTHIRTHIEALLTQTHTHTQSECNHKLMDLASRIAFGRAVSSSVQNHHTSLSSGLHGTGRSEIGNHGSGRFETWHHGAGPSETGRTASGTGFGFVCHSCESIVGSITKLQAESRGNVSMYVCIHVCMYV